MERDFLTVLLFKVLIAGFFHNFIFDKNIIDAEFTIFTDVDGAKLDYQKPTQKDLRLLTVAQAEELLRSGAFPDGSMGPKIEAAIMFVKGGGNKAYITRVDLFEQTLKQNSGTTIVP